MSLVAKMSIVALALLTTCQAALIFHGSSLLIRPSQNSTLPSQGDTWAANFYCYFEPTVGYISLGWWLSTSPGANHTHCQPSSRHYDWYEKTTQWGCDQSNCRGHMLNFKPSSPEAPDLEENYVVSFVDAGNGPRGQFGLGYFDKQGGTYAVGTRRILSDERASRQDDVDCNAAYENLVEMKQRYNLSTAFEMKNPCPRKAQGVIAGSATQGQIVLGRTA